MLWLLREPSCPNQDLAAVPGKLVWTDLAAAAPGMLSWSIYVQPALESTYLRSQSWPQVVIYMHLAAQCQGCSKVADHNCTFEH